MYPWIDTIAGMHLGCEQQGKQLLPMSASSSAFPNSSGTTLPADPG